MEVDPSKGLNEPVIFSKIEPNDIRQGSLKDGWLLCAIACLAERPALVERLFVTKEYNQNGIYELRLFKNGELRRVIVDDYFPCFPNGGPMFSRSNGNELWVLLLEKAYAKVHGGYKTLTGGLPHEAMMDLTGCPAMSLSFKEEKVQQMFNSGKLWELVKHCDEEGYLLAGATSGQDMWSDSEDRQASGNGLVPG
jgi:calpain-15